MSSILDQAFTPLAQALELRAYRQQILASNIANADTPGYRAKDLNFRAALAAETGGPNKALPLRRNDPRQIAGGSSTAPTQYVGYRSGQPMGIDGNNVDLANEEARFSRNAIAYEADLSFLSGQIKELQLAIKGN